MAERRKKEELKMRSWAWKGWGHENNKKTKEAQDFKKNSPCQHLRKCLKNMHSDVRVWGVNGTCIVYILTFCFLFL